MKRLIFPLAALVCALPTQQAAAQTPTAIYTGITNFIYVGKGGFNASTDTTRIHSTINPTLPGGGFTATGTPLNVPNHVNGIGLNQLDGFLYGVEFLASGPYSSDAKFFRIGGNGVTQQLGIVTGPTSTDAGRSVQASFVNTTAGTVDGNGTYWFMAYTMTSTTFPTVQGFDFFIGKVANVSSRTPGTGNITPTYYKLDVSHPRLQTGFSNFLGQVILLALSNQPISNADGGAEDLAVNPIDNAFYTYIQFPTSSSLTAPLQHYPLKLNTATSPWKLEPIGTTPNTIPNREIVGTYFDLLGNMFVLFSNGQYTPVNLTNGTLTNLQQSALPLINANLRGDLTSNLTCAVPLSITFMSVTGRVEGANSVIGWQTSDDRSIAKYVVERADDGKTYKAVSEQPATGAGTYTARDEMPGSSATYRINAVTLGGESGHSRVVRLAKPTAKGSQTTVHPTLLTNEAVQVQTDRPAAIVQVVSLTGQMIHTELIAAGSETIQLRGLASGTYILTVRDANTGENLLNQRIVKP